jgi:hypothetical protein
MQFRVYNKTLDPQLWSKDKRLNEEVRASLLSITNDYYESNEDLHGSFVDAYLVGSSANYNWTPESDIDLHIVINVSKLGYEEESEARTLLELMSHKWNRTHAVIIKEHKVELYIQDVNHPLRSSGIYSLCHSRWISEPQPEEVDIDENEIRRKYRNISSSITHAISSGDLEQMRKLIDDVRSKRNVGLQREGEFSTENIVFKMLRKFGDIDRLKNAITTIYDQRMSVTEGLNNPSDLIVGYTTPSLKVHAKAAISKDSGHGDLFQNSDSILKVNWRVVYSWRYRKDLNTLFWWKPENGDISQDVRDETIAYLETHFGAHNVRQKMIVSNDENSDNHGSAYRLSHGIDEYHIPYTTIGHDTNDNSWLYAIKDGHFYKVSTNKMADHDEWMKKDSRVYNYDYQGRYEPKRKMVSIASPDNIREIPEDILRMLKSEFGDDIIIKSFLEETSIISQHAISEINQHYKLYIGFIHRETYEILATAVDDEETTHYNWRLPPEKTWGDAESIKWRFRKDLNTVYWWSSPTEEEKSQLEYWLEKKLRSKYPKHQIIHYHNDKSYLDAHSLDQ